MRCLRALPALPVAVLAIGLLGPANSRPAHANVPTTDSGVIAKAQSVLGSLQDHFAEMEEIFGKLMEINTTFQESVASVTGFVDQVKGVMETVNNIAGTFETLKGIGERFRSDPAGAVREVNSTVDEIRDLSGDAGRSIEAARDHLVDAFYGVQTAADQVGDVVGAAQNIANLEVQEQIRETRLGYVREAATHGYALALNARHAGSTGGQQVQAMIEAANQSSDAHGDVVANSMVMLAVYRELAQLVALNAAMLELESVAAAASDPSLACNMPGLATSNDAGAAGPEAKDACFVGQ